MTEKPKGIIAQIEHEERIRGERKGKRNIIKKLLKKYTLNEVSEILDMEKQP